MDTKRNTIINLLWRFCERCGAQGVSFVVSIILARLLAPEVYGTVAIVTVLTGILQVFVDSGLGNALIQKKDADDLDFSSVFYFNFAMCIILYGIMWIISPLIANYYEEPILIPLFRVLGITLLISGVKNIQQAYVSKNMLFKRFFFSTLGGTIVSAFVGILLAYKGYGAWAIVAQQLTNAIIDTLVLWLTVRWRPKMIFSVERLLGLFSYGWKILVSSLLDTVYNSLQQLIIGKKYTKSDLAYYNRGNQLPSLAITNINASIDSVLLPVMSKEQNDINRIKNMTRRAIITSSYVIIPIMIGLAATADTLVELILKEKWLPSVPYIRIFCIVYMIYPIHTANLNAIKALGRSDIFLRLEIIKKIVGILLLLITYKISAIAMAYSLLAGGLFSQIVNTWPNRKLLNYSLHQQIRDILPSLLLALVMGVSVYGLHYIDMILIIKICVQVLIGAGIYILGSKIFKLEPYIYIVDIIKSKRN